MGRCHYGITPGWIKNSYSGYRVAVERKGNMGRLTSNKKVQGMGMFELAHNACYVEGGEARYRDHNLDISARGLARELLKSLADGDDAFTDDGDFDGWMVDYLQDGMDSIEGLIALFYRSLWAMADLWERLKKYEDLEGQGKLLKLPINPETTIYSIEYCCGENKGNKMGMCSRGFCSDCEKKSHYILEITAESSCKISEIGKSVFLTREEAEAALKEL